MKFLVLVLLVATGLPVVAARTEASATGFRFERDLARRGRIRCGTLRQETD